MKNIGVGDGRMGSSIFNYLLDFQFNLVWVCHPEADIDKISRQFGKRIKRSLDAGIIDKQQYEQLSNTMITKNQEDLQECDLIIEAIPEIPALKKELFAGLDEIVNPGAVFASNSSSIYPGELSPGGVRADKFIGMHFFYPVPLKNIVELTITSFTSPETIARSETFLKAIKRQHITLTEQNSFILNRIFLDFQNAAFKLVQAGNCSYQQMDHLVKDQFFPFGVFDFCDSVGLDTMLMSIRNYTHNYADKESYSQLIDKLASLVAEGRLGIKTQSGFYDYPLESFTPDIPETSLAITDHLRKIWFNSCKYLCDSAKLPVADSNHAIKEYFDLQSGPFE